MLIYYSLFFSNNILKRVFLLFTSFKKYVLVRSLQITCTINVSLILFLWLFFLCGFLFGGGWFFCFVLLWILWLLYHIYWQVHTTLAVHTNIVITTHSNTNTMVTHTTTTNTHSTHMTMITIIGDHSLPDLLTEIKGYFSEGFMYICV